MNAWIILLLLLAGNNGGNSCGCGNRNDGMNRRGGDCGCNGDSDREGRDRDGRDRDRDCDGSRFEPRFDSRPFNDRETCGCEESSN